MAAPTQPTLVKSGAHFESAVEAKIAHPPPPMMHVLNGYREVLFCNKRARGDSGEAVGVFVAMVPVGPWGPVEVPHSTLLTARQCQRRSLWLWRRCSPRRW